MNPNIDLIINDLANQIAFLSREKAIYFALATQREKEIDELRNKVQTLESELKKLKNTRSEESGSD